MLSYKGGIRVRVRVRVRVMVRVIVRARLGPHVSPKGNLPKVAMFQHAGFRPLDTNRTP